MEFLRQRSSQKRTGVVRVWTATLGLALTCCVASEQERGTLRAVSSANAAQERSRVLMTVGGKRFTVALEDNPTARAFAQLLPLTLSMAELNGNEKHARLPRSLPTNAARPGTIQHGDLMVYGSDTLVVFYEALHSSYSYTRVGRIAESAELAHALGPGNASVDFALR